MTIRAPAMVIGGHTGHAAHVHGVPRLLLRRRLHELGLRITTIGGPN